MDTQSPPAHIGQRIRALRLQRGFTQESLAQMAGISRETVRAIEAGENEPRAGNTRKLAAALGVSVSILFGEDAPDEPDVPTEGVA